MVLHHPAGEQVPVVFFHPHDWQGDVAVVLHGQGREALLTDDGDPGRDIAQLIDAGISVATADLFGQGERAIGRRPELINRHNPNTRYSAGYTYGYNHPLFAQRVHDILTLLSFIQFDEHEPRDIYLAGVGGAGPLVAIARLLAADAVASTIVDTQGFRFVDIASWRDANFLPGAVKYGDLPGLLAAGAPGTSVGHRRRRRRAGGGHPGVRRGKRTETISRLRAARQIPRSPPPCGGCCRVTLKQARPD